MWMEIEISRNGTDIRVGARGSRGEQTPPAALGMDAESVTKFASAVRVAASRAKPLAGDVLEKAQLVHSSVLGPTIATLRARLAEATSGPLLVRLSLPEQDLQAVPWEASCKPGEALGFWATAPDLLPVRGVMSSEPWQPRVIRGALRVLAIAPTGGSSLAVLQTALADRIASGEMEWLEPLEGANATATGVFERLRREPVPNILHFLGHGGQDNGVAVLRLADTDDGDESWLPVELLAQQLKANLRGMLRLIVLEACEGAKPSVFASAAEILARAGADAVVAHLWPVRSDVARVFSGQLYRALAAADRPRADIALAMNEARRAVLGSFESSAQAFSPVVYLRGPDGVLFDFKGRKVAPPVAMTAVEAPTGLNPALVRVIGKPFSLLLGDRSREQRTAVAAFRDKLQKDLAKTGTTSTGNVSMSSLAQRFVLHRGAQKLGAEFQKAFRGGTPPPSYLEALARLVKPGVHTTLLRQPWLELLLAEQQPDRTIYVIQPGDDQAMILRREGGADDWEQVDEAPAAMDTDQDLIVLRPYGGYTPEQIFARPLLTEDDYHIGVSDLENKLPRDLANTILSTLSYRPALLLGLSVHTNHHRMLLQRLFARGIPRGSLAVVDPDDTERVLWEKGSGLPGKGEGVEVMESSIEDLGDALQEAEGDS